MGHLAETLQSLCTAQNLKTFSLEQNPLIRREFPEPLGTSPSLPGPICDHPNHWEPTVKDQSSGVTGGHKYQPNPSQLLGATGRSVVPHIQPRPFLCLPHLYSSH